MLQINILFLVRLGKIGRCQEYSIRILESLNCFRRVLEREDFLKKKKKKFPFIGTER